MNQLFEHLDQAVQRLAVLRDELLADEDAPDRAARLAVVFTCEAQAWSQVYELAHLRLIWRAALAAEAGARANAAQWARRAAAERAGGAAAELGRRSGGCAPTGGPHHDDVEREVGVMPSVGAMILFSILGAVICAKARVAGGAVVFALIGLVLFVSTPAGRGLPEAVSGFVSTVDGAASPALTGTPTRRPASRPTGHGATRMSARLTAGSALMAARAEEPQEDRLRRASRSALGVARPVSRARALAALASPATA